MTKRKKLQVSITEFDDVELTSNPDYHQAPHYEKTAHHHQLSIEIEPKTANQHAYINSIKSNIITFGVGSAGTGKSYIAILYAAKQLLTRKCSKIYITRPAVECGEKLGFLPGDLADKYAEYMTPVKSILYEQLPRGLVDDWVKSGRIQPIPISYMRGMTFNDCIVVADESQNFAKVSFLMILSRVGRNCKMIINGDTKQSDIKNSGLDDAMTRLKKVPKVGMVEFTRNDIVRSDIVKDIIEAYEE